MRANHGVPTYAAELVDATQAANNRRILDHDMSTEADVVYQNHVVSDLAVVSNMTSDHEQPPITHAGHPAPAVGAGLHGDVFADDVAGADHQHGAFARVFLVLWRSSEGGKRIDLGLVSKAGLALNDHVGMQAAAVTQHHARPDVAKRADVHILPQLGAVFDHGRRMDAEVGGNHAAPSSSMPMATNSASEILVPST